MALPLQRELRFFDPGPGEQDGRWVGWGTGGGGPVQTTTVIKVRSMASPRLPLDTPALKRWMVIVSQVREIMWSQLSRLTLCHVHLRFFATFFSLFLSSYPNVLQPTDSASFEEKRRCDVPIHSVAPGFLLNLRGQLRHTVSVAFSSSFSFLFPVFYLLFFKSFSTFSIQMRYFRAENPN